MLRHKRTTFFCFSPPVMIATYVIELSLLAYTLWRYKLSSFTRLSVLLLFFLAVFQLAEFRVCTGSINGAFWSHIGYVAITLLPPLGIHALSVLRGKSSKILVLTAYATSACFVAYFALHAGSLTGHACLGNYIMFQVNESATWLYAVYYYGWVIMGTLLGWLWAKESTQKVRRQALNGFAWGFAAFLIPTTTVNLLNPTTTNGIPSIMCGFAVLFALILSLWVMPRAAALRS